MLLAIVIASGIVGFILLMFIPQIIAFKNSSSDSGDAKRPLQLKSNRLYRDWDLAQGKVDEYRRSHQDRRLSTEERHDLLELSLLATGSHMIYRCHNSYASPNLNNRLRTKQDRR